jgi:hypothetical protein
LRTCGLRLSFSRERNYGLMAASEPNPKKIDPKTGRERDARGHFVPLSKLGKPDKLGKPRPRKPARARTQAEIVAVIRKNVETKLRKDAKASLGDYIRLVQLEKDLEAGEVREIRVTWVDSEKTEVER